MKSKVTFLLRRNNLKKGKSFLFNIRSKSFCWCSSFCRPGRKEESKTDQNLHASTQCAVYSVNIVMQFENLYVNNMNVPVFFFIHFEFLTMCSSWVRN